MNKGRDFKYKYAHPLNNLVIDFNTSIKSPSLLRNFCAFDSSVSLIKPKHYDKVLEEANWTSIIQDQLNQFERNQVQSLTPRPNDYSTIRTKWVFRNKLDESKVAVRNNTRLVAKCYNQEEGTYFHDTFAPVHRLEIIRTLLTFASRSHQH